MSAAILLVFAVRRVLFTLTILFASRKQGERVEALSKTAEWPKVLVLAPCHDEESQIGGLCEALSHLDYPQERLGVVLIDDGSQDGTRELMEQFAHARANWNVLALTENRGKAAALNAALAQHPFGDIIYVFDADHRPQPDVLKRAVPYFNDPSVAGVSGRNVPMNALASASAYYSAVENDVHQMITMRAKDLLDLGPALLGSNCGYRRTALERCGSFRDGALLEDTDLTLSFYKAGYRIRFVEHAITFHKMPTTVGAYLKQHTRWGRGFLDTARDHQLLLLSDRQVPLPLRVELFLFGTGYLDRIALGAGAALAGMSHWDPRLSRFPERLLCFALLIPLGQIVALFCEQRVSPAMWMRLPWVPIFFLVDMIAAFQSVADLVSNRVPTRLRTEPYLGSHAWGK